MGVSGSYEFPEPLQLAAVCSDDTKVCGSGLTVLHCNTRDHNLGSKGMGVLNQGLRHSIGDLRLNDVVHHTYDGELIFTNGVVNSDYYAKGSYGTPGQASAALGTTRLWQRGKYFDFQLVAPLEGSGMISGGASFTTRWIDPWVNELRLDAEPNLASLQYGYRYHWIDPWSLICMWTIKVALTGKHWTENFGADYEAWTCSMFCKKYLQSYGASDTQLVGGTYGENDWSDPYHSKKYWEMDPSDVWNLCLPDALERLSQPHSWERESPLYITVVPQSVNMDWLPPLESEILTVPREVWGEMAYKCIKRFSAFDGNGIAYVKDVLTFKQFVKSALKAIKGAVTLDPKSIADLYLSFHYGLRLMVFDTKQLVKGIIKSLGNGKSYAEEKQHSQEYGEWWITYTLYRNPVPLELSNLMSVLDEFDLLPTPSNLWDLIPYSFVVDWFVDISDKLERLEALSIFTRTDLIIQGRSIKHEQQVELPVNLPAIGQVSEKYYSRGYDRSFPRVPFAAPDSSPLKSLFSHWLEGASLIIQRIG